MHHYNKIESDICRVSRRLTNSSPFGRLQGKKVQPSVEQLYEIARHLDVGVKELLVSSKNIEANVR